ncbi:ATP-dependent protease subunit HslV [bacterium]|nr:ATP-dependent protease subunit HslV [bacterium]
MRILSTTILCVRKHDQVCMGGDGQVTLGNMIIKGQARKVRRMADGKVLGGFAGSAADGLSLFDRFEKRLQEFPGQLRRAAVELARDWRTERSLRRLEAMLIVADKDTVLVLSGTGEVLEPDDQIASVGSGSGFALAAARGLLRNTEMSAEAIVRGSLEIAGEICIYTNQNLTIETL